MSSAESELQPDVAAASTTTTLHVFGYDFDLGERATDPFFLAVGLCGAVLVVGGIILFFSARRHTASGRVLWGLLQSSAQWALEESAVTADELGKRFEHKDAELFWIPNRAMLDSWLMHIRDQVQAKKIKCSFCDAPPSQNAKIDISRVDGSVPDFSAKNLAPACPACKKKVDDDPKTVCGDFAPHRMAAVQFGAARGIVLEGLTEAEAAAVSANNKHLAMLRKGALLTDLKATLRSVVHYRAGNQERDKEMLLEFLQESRGKKQKK